uniref:Beta-agarase n=1 Tax=Catenovulum sp. X3 TaxID=756463 RepID=D5LUQ3_9ALTE|nr:beta-agarase [Catenovulum sp. X3]
MKLLNKFSRAQLFGLLAGVCCSTTAVQAATFTVYNETQLNNALTSAQNNGLDTLDTIKISGTINIYGQIDIKSSVKITGAQTNRASKLTRRNTGFYNPLINVQYKNVTVENITLEGIGANTNQQLLSLAGDDTSNSALINLPATAYATNPKGFTATNVNFFDSAIGVASVGILPQDLNVSYNTFRNINRAVELLRDVDRVDDALLNNAQIKVNGNIIGLYGGKLNISNNLINAENMRLAISLDGGNDGAGFIGSGFLNPWSEKRQTYTDKPVYYSSVIGEAVINNNRIGYYQHTDGAVWTVGQTREFGIALATVANIYVVGNHVRTGLNFVTQGDGVTPVNNASFGFGSAINVEHNGENIVIQSNHIHVGAKGNGANAFTILAFNDHGAYWNLAQTSKNLTYANNVISGSGANVFYAIGYRNLNMLNNDVRNFSSSGAVFGCGGVVSPINNFLANVPGGYSNSYIEQNPATHGRLWFDAVRNNGQVVGAFTGQGSRAPRSFYYLSGDDPKNPRFGDAQVVDSVSIMGCN